MKAMSDCKIHIGKMPDMGCCNYRNPRHENQTVLFPSGFCFDGLGDFIGIASKEVIEKGRGVVEEKKLTMADLTHENTHGHYLQNPDGTFTRNTSKEKFEYWKLCLERQGITEVNLVKESKNSHFKVLVK